MKLDLWFQAMWEVLLADEEACVTLIRAAGGHVQQAVVSLVEGDVSVLDGLVYVRTLVELGFMTEAREVFSQVLTAAFSI